MVPRGGCWPTDAQVDLLRAALLQGRDGVRAWERWRSAADLQRLDAASSRLLGHLWWNLRRNGVTDPLLSALRGVYRRTWYDNQLRLREAASVLAGLRDRGIEPMLLKGAALIAAHHQDAGLRPMEDVDVLVRSHQALEAAAALSEIGLTPAVAVTPRHLAASHAMAFADSCGRQVDLHWHLLPESCGSRADSRLWERARSGRVGDVEVRVPDPAHQLFHACAHGVRWEPVAPLRWIADAAMVMTRASTLDWDLILEETERRRVALVVREALAYVRRVVGLPVPPEMIECLHAMPVSMSERLAYRWRTRPAGRLLGRLPEHWLRYRRLRRGPAGDRPAIGFVGYLEVTFGCQGPGSLAGRALMRHRWRRRSQVAMEDYERGLAGAAADRSPARG